MNLLVYDRDVWFQFDFPVGFKALLRKNKVRAPLTWCHFRHQVNSRKQSYLIATIS